MPSFTLRILLGIATQAHVKEIAANPIGDLQNSMDKLLDSLVDNLFEQIFDRGIKGPPLNAADKGDTTLGMSSHLRIQSSRLSPHSSFIQAHPSHLNFPFRSDIRHATPRGTLQQVEASTEEPAVPMAALSSPVARQDIAISRRMALAGSVGLTSGLALSNSALADGLDPFNSKKRKKLKDLTVKTIRRKLESGELEISPGDILRCVINDALTYYEEGKDRFAKFGIDGSIRFELDRPENAGLAPVIKKLEALQKEITAESGIPITFADVEAFTGRLVFLNEFKKIGCAKIGCENLFGEDIYNQFSNKGRDLFLGRFDAKGPNPEGRVPWKGSSVDDFIAAFKRLGLSIKQIATLTPGILDNEAAAVELLRQNPALDEQLQYMDVAKATKTRTNYEAEFLEAYALLTNGPPAYAFMYSDSPFEQKVD